MLYLLDTNIVSAPMRPTPDTWVQQRLARLDKSVAISATTLSELRFGLLRLPESQRREHFRAYLDRFIAVHRVLPFDQAAAEWHAGERARLSQLGRTPPFADGQIAAVAATHKLTLVTLNPRDFEAFEGLQVEDWSAPAG